MSHHDNCPALFHQPVHTGAHKLQEMFEYHLHLLPVLAKIHRGAKRSCTIPVYCNAVNTQTKLAATTAVLVMWGMLKAGKQQPLTCTIFLATIRNVINHKW